MTSDRNFYGDKLRLVRVLHGLTQQELGDFASVSRQYIHQLESGTKIPAPDVLDVLCESLDVHASFFCEPLGNDVKLEQCHFRKRRTTPVSLSNTVLAFSTVLERVIAFINQKLDLPENAIPVIEAHPETFSMDEIERVAEKCRKVWYLGIDTPIARMTRVLENAGIVITEFDGVSDKVDAFSFNRQFPIIIRNTAKESVCRMRFDLAHELGHLILHDGKETGDKTTEDEANRFASAFIFPRIAFVREFPNMIGRQLSWKRIYQLKIRWGMSARAILYRAYQLGRISAQQYRSGNVYLNKSGQAKVEKFDNAISPEIPELLSKAFSILRDQLGISFSYIAKSIGIKAKLLGQVCGITPTDDTGLENVVPI